MTERELNQIYWLRKEIKQLDKNLQRLENMSLIKSPIITGMPFGNKTNDTVARYSCDIIDLQNELINKRQKYLNQAKIIENYVDSITDSEIRQIVRLRHIDGLTWDEIGGEMNMDRSTVSKKYHNFIKKSHKSHEECDIIYNTKYN